jgi:hypothetical protein
MSDIMQYAWSCKRLDHLSAFFALKTVFEKRALEVALEYARITGEYYIANIAEIDWEETDMNDTTVGGTEYRAISANFRVQFPTRYLWEDEWQEQLRAEIAEKKRLKEQQKQEQKEKDKANKEEGERKLYERLRAKYGQD